MNRSLLLTDVDGTLVDAAGRLWPETYGIVRAARAFGWTVALCSARPSWSICSLADQLGSAVEYAVSFQGALVSRRVVIGDRPFSNWKTLRRCLLGYEVAASIESLIRPDDSLWWYTETDWRVRSVNEAAKFESKVVRAAWTAVGLNHDHDPLLKILVVRVERPELLLAELNSTSLPVMCSVSQTGYVEIVSSAVGGDKGASFLRSLERSGDSSPHTVAIGDGTNDLGMFSVADIAVTFEDASAEVRAAADVILPKNRRIALQQLSSLLMGDLQ